jgi:Uncharacterized protein conserved in bacteria
MTGYSRRLGAAAVAAFVLLPALAFAQAGQPKLQGMAFSNDQPIQIESDRLEIKEQEKRAIFSGNVKVVQGETTLQAGSMVVHYKSDNKSVSSGATDIETIDVADKVVIRTATQTASADKGSFDMTAQVAVLEGKKVVLTEGDNIFIGCRLTVRMQSGEAKLDSCGGRVMIQLDPKSQPKP